MAQNGLQLVDHLEKQIEELRKKESIIQGKIASSSRADELTQIKQQIKALENLRAETLSSLENAIRSRQRQQKLLQDFDLLTKSRS